MKQNLPLITTGEIPGKPKGKAYLLVPPTLARCNPVGRPTLHKGAFWGKITILDAANLAGGGNEEQGEERLGGAGRSRPFRS